MNSIDFGACFSLLFFLLGGANVIRQYRNYKERKQFKRLVEPQIYQQFFIGSIAAIIGLGGIMMYVYQSWII